MIFYYESKFKFFFFFWGGGGLELVIFFTKNLNLKDFFYKESKSYKNLSI